MKRCWILYFSIFLFSLCSSIPNRDVPVILWNIKGNSIQLQPVSAFDDGAKSTALDLIEDLNDYSTGIIVFLVDKLSLEDLAIQSNLDYTDSTIKILESFLDQQPHVMHPNVKDPEDHLRKTACGVDDIYMTPSMEGNLDKAIPAALKHSCVVVVHLPHNLILGESNLSMAGRIFLPEFKSSWKNVIGIFTAKSSSWDSSEVFNHKSRGLLALEDTISHLVNVSGFMLYAEDVLVEIGDQEPVSLSFPPKSVDSGKNESQLTLTFEQSGKITGAQFNFAFHNSATSWKLASASVKVTGEDAPEEEVPLHVRMEAPESFSYSCGRLILRSKNPDIPVTVYMERFQIQLSEDEKFKDSFNCVHWFTLPIWMGSFIVVFFVTILNVGVYFLFQAKTMDRFDDPKGKTISVPQTD